MNKRLTISLLLLILIQLLSISDSWGSGTEHGDPYEIYGDNLQDAIKELPKRKDVWNIWIEVENKDKRNPSTDFFNAKNEVALSAALASLSKRLNVQVYLEDSITRIPNFLRGCSNIEALHIEGDDLRELPPSALKNLSNLIDLSIKAQNLKEIGDLSKELKNLDQIEITSSNLQSISRKLKLSKLRHATLEIPNVKEIDFLEGSDSLGFLTVSNGAGLTRLPNVFMKKNFEFIHLIYISNSIDLSKISEMKKGGIIWIERCELSTASQRNIGKIKKVKVIQLDYYSLRNAEIENIKNIKAEYICLPLGRSDIMTDGPHDDSYYEIDKERKMKIKTELESHFGTRFSTREYEYLLNW